MKRLAWIAALLLAPALPAVPQEEEPREPLAPAWSRPLPNTQGLAISPDGERVVALAESLAQGLDRGGEVVWQQHLEGVDAAVLSRRGVTAVLYARRRPLYRKVFFLDREGKRIGMVEAPEAVETVSIAPDGRYAAIASGRSILFCSRTQQGIQHRTVRLEGTASQVQMGSGDTFYVACRAPAYVALLKSTGSEVWRRRQEGVAEYAISGSADGRMVAISAPLASDNIQTWLVTARNSVRWTDLRRGRRPRLRLSANGTAATLSYELPVEGARGTRFERRLTYLAQGARGAWPKGGPFSAPLPVSIDGDGAWVVALDTQRRGAQPRFRLYGSGGERRWLYLVPAAILIAVGSGAGEHIATYRSDGVLELLRISAP